MTPRDIALALLVVVIWGFNFVVIKVGVAEVPPLFLTGLRFLFAALPAVFLLPRPKTPAALVIGFGLVLGVVKFGMLFVAIRMGMPAGLSSLVLQMQAFFTMGLAFLLLGERPTRWQLGGAAVAGGGIAVIASGVEAEAGLFPFLLLLAAALSWGVANVITKRAGRIDMLSFVVWASLVPPLPLFALSLAFEGPDAIAAALAAPSALAVGAVLYLAYPTTVLAFGIWNALLSRHPSGTVAPFSLLVPVVGIASGSLVLGEPMTGAAVLGGALVFSGLLLNVFGGRVFAALRPATGAGAGAMAGAPPRPITPPPAAGPT
jgi:O-acetylserine/cysteine efflux transporter